MTNPFLTSAEPSLQQIANDARDQAKASAELQKTVPQMNSVLSSQLAAGRQMIQDAGVKVGDLVTISWRVDDAYGGGFRSHIGTVEKLDDWIHIGETNRSPGHLRMPIAAMHHIRIERGAVEDLHENMPLDKKIVRDLDRPSKTNPFMNPDRAQANSMTNNPFMI